MKPILIKQSNGEFTSNITKVIACDSVMTYEDTVLDEKYCKNGAVIPLPSPIFSPIHKKMISNVYVPPSKHTFIDNLIVLDNVQVRINNLLRVLELNDIKLITKSVNSLFNQILKTVSGKSGFINRIILGRRSGFTARGVLLASTDSNPANVYLPSAVMKKLNLKDGEFVLVGRDPTIWNGSIEILVAQTHAEKTIRVHPFIFSQFGADCDGDTVWVSKLKNQDLASSKCLEFTKKYKTITKAPSIQNGSLKIDWSNPNQSKILNNVSGFSISPKDILNNNDNLSVFFNYSKKNVAEESNKIIRGLTNEEFLQYLSNINTTMLIQKIYLGPLGAASQKIKLIASRNPALQDSSNYLSERIQQMLFDVKGVVTAENSDLDKFFEILDIINIKGRYSLKQSSISYKKALDRMELFGFDRALSYPVIVYLYSLYAVSQTVNSLNVNNSIKNDCYALISSVLLNESSLLDLFSKIAKLVDSTVTNLTPLYLSFRSNNTLTSILSDPIYSLVNLGSSDTMLNGISRIHKIFNNKQQVFNFTGKLVAKSFECGVQND